jgi:hypothetical protein
VQGCGINLSPDLGSTTGQVVAAVAAPASLWAWESPSKRFEWSEVVGPAAIRLAVFGYFAVRVVRASGVRVLTVS